VVVVAALLVTALLVADVANVDFTAAFVVALFGALAESPQVPKPD
jgi:hypothetical protein